MPLSALCTRHCTRLAQLLQALLPAQRLAQAIMLATQRNASPAACAQADHQGDLDPAMSNSGNKERAWRV